MIILTKKAADEFRRVIIEQNMAPETMLRVSIEGGGCSGFSYKLGFEDTAQKDDICQKHHGLTVITDRKSHLYLDGIEIDWVDGLDGRGFKFNNPNATKSCGCGSSFQA